MTSLFAPPDDFFQLLGVDLNENSRSAFVENFRVTLMERVIAAVAETLSDDQLYTLGQMKGKDDGIIDWLQDNVPNLKAIVDDEIDILIGEIIESRDMSVSA
jgi:HEAT repeat protein